MYSYKHLLKHLMDSRVGEGKKMGLGARQAWVWNPPLIPIQTFQKSLKNSSVSIGPPTKWDNIDPHRCTASFYLVITVTMSFYQVITSGLLILYSQLWPIPLHSCLIWLKSSSEYCSFVLFLSEFVCFYLSLSFILSCRPGNCITRFLPFTYQLGDKFSFVTF